jgi:hypothetical protein
MPGDCRPFPIRAVRQSANPSRWLRAGALAAVVVLLCAACAASGQPAAQTPPIVLISPSGPKVPTGPPASVSRGARAIKLPGTEVTYYEVPSAPVELGSYLGISSDTDYVRAPPGGFAPLPDGQGTISPGGRWLAAVMRPQSGIAAGTALTVVDRGTGRSRTIPTPGFQLWANSVLSWSNSGTRLFVTAVVDDRNIGFAYGDAPGFRLHLVHVPGGGFPKDSAFFFSNANGTGAVDNSSGICAVWSPPRLRNVTVNLSGLVTGILAIDRSLEIPEMFFTARARRP